MMDKEKTCKDCSHAINNDGCWHCYRGRTNISTEDIDFSEKCPSFEPKSNKQPETVQGQICPDSKKLQDNKSEYLKEIQDVITLLYQVQQLFRLQKYLEEQVVAEEPIDYGGFNFYISEDFDFIVRGSDMAKFLRDYFEQEISSATIKLQKQFPLPLPF